MSKAAEFVEKVKSDPELQKKLQASFDGFSGEQTEKAIFNEILSPIASEVGFSLTFEEVKQESERMRSAAGQLNEDELGDVVAGRDFNDIRFGAGSVDCQGAGVGLGVAVSQTGASGCLMIGGGSAKGFCIFTGVKDFDGDDKLPVKIKRDAGMAWDVNDDILN